MKNQNGFAPVIIFLIALIGFVGVYYLGTFKPKTITVSSIPNAVSVDRDFLCKREENCCLKDDDCKYVWVTGACNTLEHVAKKQKESTNQGRREGEAPPRENVICTCELNKCVTHN